MTVSSVALSPRQWPAQAVSKGQSYANQIIRSHGLCLLGIFWQLPSGSSQRKRAFALLPFTIVSKEPMTSGVGAFPKYLR